MAQQRGGNKKEYDNTNSGTLFKNARRRNNKDPEYTGQGNFNGVECWISAWVKEKGENTQNPGEKFFSLSFRPKDDGGNSNEGGRSSGGNRQGASRSGGGRSQDGGDDVPF